MLPRYRRVACRSPLTPTSVRVRVVSESPDGLLFVHRSFSMLVAGEVVEITNTDRFVVSHVYNGWSLGAELGSLEEANEFMAELAGAFDWRADLDTIAARMPQVRALYERVHARFSGPAADPSRN